MLLNIVEKSGQQDMENMGDLIMIRLAGKAIFLGSSSLTNVTPQELVAAFHFIHLTTGLNDLEVVGRTY